MTIKDLVDKLTKSYREGKVNLSKWQEVVTTPKLRQEYGSFVVKPAVKQAAGLAFAPYKMYQDLERATPGGIKQGARRVGRAIKRDPVQFTPLSMREKAVPISRQVFGKKLGTDIGYGMRGALTLTPFQRGKTTWEPTTKRQKFAQKVGKAAYGTALTAPLGGPNILKNILTRTAQGATLGTGIGMASNILQKKPITTDIKSHALTGVETAWQLAFTNQATDWAITKASLNIPTMSKASNAFKLLAKASKKGASNKVKTDLFVKGALQLFKRALAEVPAETTMFTGIDKLSGEEKESFTKAWLRNLPGVVLGNLLFAGADVSVRGSYNFNKKQIDQAVKALKTTLKSQEGAIRLPKPSKEKAKGKLSHILRYGDNLRRSGWEKVQIDKIGPKEARSIFQQGILPTEHPTSKFRIGPKAPKFRIKAKAAKESPTDWLEDGYIKDIQEHVSGRPPKEKVSVLDYARTPDRVLKKIGLEKESKILRKSYDAYLQEMPKEIDKITAWSKRANRPGSEERIYKWLDGQKVKLEGEEEVVAKEIKTYLKGWADRLGLPEDKRITNYITRIWERGQEGTEFPEDIAKIISEKVPGSVYDPFLQQRLGKKGYVENVWRALDAYVKRATRKVNLDPALKEIQTKAETLDVESYKYIQRYLSSINLRPTELDSLVDNFIKTTPIGYRFTQRPTAYVTRFLRNLVYKGALGMNLGASLKNLTQGINTYSKLGEKYTTIGYINLLKRGGMAGDEIKRSGILQDNFIQDRNLTAVKNFWQKIDKGLWLFFDTAEKINRSSGYWGAKKKALDQGMSEEQAIEYAKKLVSDTQFKFSSLDTPMVLRDDISKLLLQFQSFSMKQVEFIGEMVASKDIPAMLRFTAANLLMLKTAGEFLGLDWQSVFFPSVKVGQTPPIEAAKGGLELAAGKMTGDEELAETGKRKLFRAGTTFIPAGVQIKKTYEGLQGESRTPSGNLRFRTTDTPTDYVTGTLLGPWKTKPAREYLQTLTLGKKQTSQRKKLKAEIIKRIEAGENISDLVNDMGQARMTQTHFKEAIKEGLVDAIERGDLEAATKLKSVQRAIGIKDETIEKALRKSQFSPLDKKELINNLIQALIDKDLESATELKRHCIQMGITEDQIMLEIRARQSQRGQ